MPEPAFDNFIRRFTHSDCLACMSDPHISRRFVEMTAISSKFPTGPICHPQFFSSKDLLFGKKKRKMNERVSEIAFLKNGRCFKIQRLITTFFSNA